LSLESIHDFTELISETFDFLTYPVWLSLIPRLTLSVARPCQNDRRPPSFVPCEGGELNGIMSFLSGKCGGNIHDRGIVAVSASSQYLSDRPVQLLLISTAVEAFLQVRMSQIRGFASNSRIIASNQLIIQSARELTMIVTTFAHGILRV
jgi:hypothetical protein